MKYSILSLILTLLFLGHGDLLAANDFRERIYVQTDKQVYLAGELLWLKLCVTDATGIPVSFSKVGYVELLDESTALVQAKIEIKEGIGEGWLELPALLPTGYYRLVAYTRYMRNESDRRQANCYKTYEDVEKYASNPEESLQYRRKTAE